MIHEYVVIH